MVLLAVVVSSVTLPCSTVWLMLGCSASLQIHAGLLYRVAVAECEWRF